MHGDRSGLWSNPGYDPPAVRTRRRTPSTALGSFLSEAAGEIREQGRTPVGTTGWQAWADQAHPVVVAWLGENHQPFTTAEHLWPLLDAPPEKRAMSHVVQRLLREGQVREIGSRRLRGTYRSRDGHEFKENKLVPVYQSLIPMV